MDHGLDGARVWPAADFEIATPNGPQWRTGYAMAGLGLYMMQGGSPKGRRKPLWSVTHIGTGHFICTLRGDVRTAFPVATEIAQAGDWTFDGLTGFKNQFPEAPERMREIAAKYPRIVGHETPGVGSDEGQARTIAMNRVA